MRPSKLIIFGLVAAIPLLTTESEGTLGAIILFKISKILAIKAFGPLVFGSFFMSKIMTLGVFKHRFVIRNPKINPFYRLKLERLRLKNPHFGYAPYNGGIAGKFKHGFGLQLGRLLGGVRHLAGIFKRPFKGPRVVHTYSTPHVHSSHVHSHSGHFEALNFDESGWADSPWTEVSSGHGYNAQPSHGYTSEPVTHISGYSASPHVEYNTGYSSDPHVTHSSGTHGYSDVTHASGYADVSSLAYGSPQVIHASYGSPQLTTGYSGAVTDTSGYGHSNAAAGYSASPQVESSYSSNPSSEYGTPAQVSGYGAPSIKPTGYISSNAEPSGYSAPAGNPSGYSVPAGNPSGYGAPSGSSNSKAPQEEDTYSKPPDSSYINGPPAVYSPSSGSISQAYGAELGGGSAPSADTESAASKLMGLIDFDPLELLKKFTMPSTAQTTTSRRRREVEDNFIEDTSSNLTDVEMSQEELLSFLDTFYFETELFFGLLDTFDDGGCLQKLVCEIHSAEAQNLTKGWIGEDYRRNTVTTFKLLDLVIPTSHMDTSFKYRLAARLGSASPDYGGELCNISYRDCKYSADEIVGFGEEADETIKNDPEFKGHEKEYEEEVEKLAAQLGLS